MWNFKNTITGTLTGLRISNVSGAYFFDNCSALLPYADGRSVLQIFDASSRKFEAVLGLRGTGETLDSELISSWSNSTGGYPFEVFTSSGVNITEATETGTAGRGISNILSLSLYGLYKTSFSATINSGGDSTNPYLGMFCVSNGNAAQEKIYITGNGDYSGYKTAQLDVSTYRYCEFRTGVAVSFSIASPSFRKVLTPSSDGISMLSAPTVDVSFTYNAVSYTYKLFTNVRII